MKPRAICMLTAMLAAVVTALGGACSSPDTAKRIDPIDQDAGPYSAAFKAVSPMLVRRCGSIDCHGSTYRNFRLYGFGGTRLKAGPPDDPPLVLDEEAKSNYDAVIGIEPELTSLVVKEGGKGYEQLTLVRKGRGAEAHKGGPRLVAGDRADECLRKWLAGRIQLGDSDCSLEGCVSTNGEIKSEACGR